MAEKDLSLGEWRPDDDLDFNFNSEINTGLDQESKTKSRSAISSVATGLREGATNRLTDPSLYNRVLKAALPKHYGDITEAASEVSGGLYELYDQTQKEVKPRLNRLTRSLDKMVPEESKGIKKLIGKIVDLTGGRDDEMAAPDTSSQEDQAVTMMLGDIFKAQLADGKVKESRQIMRDAIENKRFAKTADLSSKMQRDISILQQYTTSVTQAFQKKSLELQLRTYLGQRAYFTRSLELMEVFKKQNEAIVKNTSLPDAAKITEFERMKTIGKDRFINSLYGDDSTWKKGIDRIKGAAGEYVQGITRRMDMAQMGVDMAAMGADQLKEMNAMMAEMGLPPMTKAQLAGAVASGWAIDSAADWASPKLKAIVDEYPEFKEKLAKAAQFVLNPAGKIAKFRWSDNWKEKQEREGMEGKMYRFMDFLMEQFTEMPDQVSYKTGASNDELKEGRGFDNKAYLSLTTVIPGYLSMIHQSLASQRSGSDAPYYRYDFEAGRFKTDKLIGMQVKQKMVEAAKRSGYGYSVNQAAETLIGDHVGVTDTEQTTLKRFLSKLSTEGNMEYDPESIEKSETYRSLSPNEQDIVDIFLERMSSAADRETRIAELTRSVQTIREKTPSYRSTIEDIVRSGNGDLLAKSGVIKRTDDGFVTDPEKLLEFTEEHTVRSDVNVKEDIAPTSPMGLLKTLGKKAYEGMKNTPLYNWRYKKGVGDREMHSGPMAQDVQENLGDEAAPGGKKIDLQTMNGTFFAAVQHLGSKIDSLFKGKKSESDDKVKGEDPIKNIDSNVARIAAILATNNGVPGSAGGGHRYREGFSLDYFLDKGTEAGKKAGQAVKDGLSAAGSKIADLWKANEEPLKEKATWLFEKGSELAGTVFDSTKKFVTDIVPGWIGKVKDFGKKVWDAVDKQFQTVKDLYLPNGTEPVIRAAKIKAGEYYDEVSGKVIESVEELLAVKGNIVDKAGNIVVSSKELATGLYDRYGEEVKGRIASAASFVASGTRWAAGKLVDAAGKLKDMAVGGASKIKEWWDNSPEFKMPEFGMSFYGKKHLAELINIRDILLGESKNVRKRIKKSAAGGGGGGTATNGNDTASSGGSIQGMAADLTARYAAPGSFLGNIMDRAKGLGRKAATMATVATRPADFVGPASREEMEAAAKLEEKKGGIASRFGSVKDFFKNKFGKTDSGDFVGPVQPTSAKVKGKIGDMVSKVKGSSIADKAGRLFKSGKGKLGALASFAGGLLTGSGQPAEASPGGSTDGADGKTDQQKEAEAFKNAEANAAKATNKRGQVAAKDRQAGDNDGDGVKDGSTEDRRNKIEALKAQRDKGMLEADTGTKYKSSENVIDTMAKKAAGLIDTLKGGLGSVFDLASTLFSGGKGVARGIFGALKGLGRGAMALGRLTGGGGAGFGTAARAAMLGLRGYGAAVALSTTAAGSTLAGLGSLALSAATAVAGTVLSALASPVVLTIAAVAAASYGFYKLYKYANRNNASDMERLRLNQYGFGYNSTADRYNHHVYMLEAYLQDGRIGYESNGMPYILDKNVDIKEVLSIFEIDEKDREAVDNFNAWFSNRFKPVFFAHLAALLKADKKKKLHEVDDLESEQKLTYLEQAKFPNGPYNYDISPLGEKFQLTVDDVGIKESYDNLILKVKLEVDKTAKKHKGIEKPDEPQKGDTKTPAKKENKIDNLKLLKQNQETNKNIVGKDALGEGDGRAPAGGGASGSSSDGGSSGSGSGSSPMSAAASRVNMAAGSLLDGANGMQFINLRSGSKLDGLSPAMLKQFLGMAEEYGNATGKTIPVNSGYRSFEQQAELYRRDPSKAAKPGRSLHEFGLALDIDSAVANELDKLGLMKKYGFTRPVGGEPWHMEPALIQRSIDLAKNSASERERMVEMSAGLGGGGYGTVPNSAKGKRNHEMAMSLLDMPSKIVENKSDQAKDVYKAAESKAMASTEEPAKSAITEPVNQAANDSSFSKKNALPDVNVESINSKANTAMVSPDAESAKSTTTTSGESSSGGGTVEEALDKAAQKTGVSAELLKTFAAVESGMNPNAKSSNSSAQGLMQFMPKTWDEVVSKHGSKYGLSRNASPLDPDAAALMGGEYLKSNMKLISGVRPNPNAVDLYFTHLLGPTGARRFFEADPSQSVDMVLGNQARSNAALFYADGRPLTVAEAYERVKKRVAEKASAFGLKADISGPGLKAPKTDEPSTGIKTPSTGGVQPNVSGPEPVQPTAPKRGFSFDTTSAGLSTQGNQSGQRNDTPVNVKLEELMEKSNDTASESLKQLKTIAESLSEERLAKVLAAVMAVVQKQEKPEETVKAKDKENMQRTATARGSSLDLSRKTAA